MGRLLDEGDVIDAIYKALRTPLPDYRKDPFHDSMGVAIAMANEIPPAQPERKKGTYTESGDDDEWYGRYKTCNECGKEWMGSRNFCPNCGVAMRGEVNENQNS